MKKLILLAAVAAGVAYVVKFKSEQVKSAATKVTRDPRVQSTLATAAEKAADKVGPVASALKPEASEPGAVDDSLDDFIGDEELDAPAVPQEAVEVAEADPVSAPEVTRPSTAPDPLTDPLTAPLETLETPEAAETPKSAEAAESGEGTETKPGQ